MGILNTIFTILVVILLLFVGLKIYNSYYKSTEVNCDKLFGKDNWTWVMKNDTKTTMGVTYECKAKETKTTSSSED